MERAQSFDAQVQADADKISSDYAGLVALSIRQTFGATEITLSKNSGGTFNTSDVMTFMKGKLTLAHFNRSRELITRSCRNLQFRGMCTQCIGREPLLNLCADRT